MSPRPPPKISLRHDWTRGNDELGSTVEQQPVGKFNSLVEKFNMFNSPNQPNQNPNQSVIDRRNLRIQNMFVVKGETSRSHEIDEKVCTKNFVLQIDQGNLIICLKTTVLSKLTMEQGNLLSETSQVHTQ